MRSFLSSGHNGMPSWFPVARLTRTDEDNNSQAYGRVDAVISTLVTEVKGTWETVI